MPRGLLTAAAAITGVGSRVKPGCTVCAVSRGVRRRVLADWAAAALLEIQCGLVLPQRARSLLLVRDIDQVVAYDGGQWA